MHHVGKLHKRNESPLEPVNGNVMCEKVSAGRASPAAPGQELRSDSIALRLGGPQSAAELFCGSNVQATITGVIGQHAEWRMLRRLRGESNIDRSVLLVDEHRVNTSRAGTVDSVASCHASRRRPVNPEHEEPRR